MVGHVESCGGRRLEPLGTGPDGHREDRVPQGVGRLEFVVAFKLLKVGFLNFLRLAEELRPFLLF
jgi:hypothetical protein